MAVYTPLLRPGAYYRRQERPSLLIGVGVVVLYTIVSSAFIGWVLQRLLEKMGAWAVLSDARIEQFLTNEIVGHGLTVLVLGWLLTTFFMWVGLRAVGGSGGLRDTLAVVGESILSYLVIYPIHMWAFLGIVQRAPVEIEPALRYWRGIQAHRPVTLLVPILLAALWALVIRTVGLAKVHEISVYRAGLVATVVGGFHVLTLLG